MSGAFGEETRKQALLQDLRDEGAVYQLWATQNAFEGDLSPIARDFDLHPAFVRIMPVLGAYGGDGAKAFYLAAIEALPVGGDAVTALRRWFLFAWDEPTWGLSLKLTDTPLLADAQAIIDLVRTSIDAPVDKGTWRAARGRLVAAQAAAGLNTDLTDAVLSMAWNLDQTPGAAGDVVNSWSGPILWGAYADDEDQLTEQEGEILNQHMRKAHEAAVAELGELKQDAETFAAYERITQAFWDQNPQAKAIRQRQAAQRERAQAKVAAWRVVAQRALVGHLAAAPTAVAG